MQVSGDENAVNKNTHVQPLAEAPAESGSSGLQEQEEVSVEISSI